MQMTTCSMRNFYGRMSFMASGSKSVSQRVKRLTDLVIKYVFLSHKDLIFQILTVIV